MGLTQRLGTIPLAIQTDSSNNVGIGGAANASYKLSVTGSSLFTSALTSINSAGTFFSATNTVGGFAKLEVSANATSIATLSFTNSLNLTGGNVGIGTNTFPSSPNRLLFLNAPSGAAAQFLLGENGTSYAYLYGYGGDAGLFTSSAIPLIFGTNSTERMRITSSGNVGIGTSTPSAFATLSVNKNGTTEYSGVNITNANSSANLFVGIGGSSVGNGSLQNNAYVLNAANTALVFGTNDTERMRITGGGLVGIGAVPNTSTTNGTLIVARDGAYPGDVNPANLMLCGITNTGKRMTLGYDTTNNYGYLTAGEYGIQWTSIYLQKTGGAVYAGSARIDNNSDARVKDNIQPISNALDKVLAMTGKKFHMIDEPENKIRLGFIAQELQGVVDELVIESDRTHKLPNGEVIENLLGLETWGSSWAALLVEAIKELNAKVTALENK